jgi:hypothetical protein
MTVNSLLRAALLDPYSASVRELANACSTGRASPNRFRAVSPRTADIESFLQRDVIIRRQIRLIPICRLPVVRAYRTSFAHQARQLSRIAGAPRK